MNTCPSSSIIIESEQTMIDYPMESFSTLSDTWLSDDFDSFLDMVLSSSLPFTISPEILPEDLAASLEDGVTRSSSYPSQSTISKTIVISRLPVTVNRRRLRTLFPGYHKITFKKNHWNKKFRL